MIKKTMLLLVSDLLLLLRNYTPGTRFRKVSAGDLFAQSHKLQNPEAKYDVDFEPACFILPAGNKNQVDAELSLHHSVAYHV
ncbi:MAG: hypothetical protein AAFQ94_04770 [Bacteroidota bacterium]